MSIYQYYNGQWIDYEKQKAGIMIYKNGQWRDGAEDLVNPPVSVHKFNNGKWLQMYPTGRVTYTDTYTAKNLKFIHTQSTSFTTDTTRPNGDAKAGIWQSTAIYTGLLNLTPSTCPVSVGRGNVDEIVDITARYIRRGVGYWENELPLALVLSTMLTPNLGGYTVHHSSKVGSTMLSDTPMVPVPGGTSAEVSGTTTFNNQNAVNMMKNFMNYSNYSILLGYKESSNTPYIGLYGLELDVTYTSTVYRALFPNVPLSYKMKRDSNNNVEMWLYKDELDMSFEEIMKHRSREGRSMIETSNVTVNSL